MFMSRHRQIKVSIYWLISVLILIVIIAIITPTSHLFYLFTYDHITYRYSEQPRINNFIFLLFSLNNK